MEDHLDVADVYAQPTFDALVAKVEGSANASANPTSADQDLDDLFSRLQSGDITPDMAADLMGKDL